MRKRFDAATATFIVECDSPADWRAAFEPVFWASKRSKESHTKSPEWYDAPSAAAAIARLSEGYPPACARISELAKRVTLPTIASIKRKPAWLPEGDELSFERLEAGREDCFRGTYAAPGVKRYPRHYCLLADTTGHCGESADSIAWASASALALADAIQASGRSVTIIAWGHLRDAYRDQRASVAWFIPVKQPSEPINLSLLAATLSPGAFRTIGFGVAEAMGRTSGGLGYPTHSLPHAWVPPAMTITIPPIRNSLDAQAWLADQAVKIQDPQEGFGSDFFTRN